KDDTLYLFTFKGAPNGRVITVDSASPGEENWLDLIPERSDAAMESVTFTEGQIVVNYIRGASNTLEAFDLAGKSTGVVPLPTIGTVATVDNERDSSAFFEFASFNHPPTIYRFDAGSPGSEPTLWARVESAIDPEAVVVTQVWYDSADGTKVSMFVVHRRGLELDGNNPTILTGYGGFGVSRTPTFSATLSTWFEDGGVYAVPNLRGGGEYGDAWHEAGMLGHKQNVFDDFAAAARWLIDTGYTNPSRLAAMG